MGRACEHACHFSLIIIAFWTHDRNVLTMNLSLVVFHS